MRDFFDNAPLNNLQEDKKDYIFNKGDIILKKAFFAYDKTKNIFSDFSISIS
jgi:hypothetical protein